MTAATQETFGELAPWQSMLERYSELFVEMQDGSRIGIVSREASRILPGKHQAGLQMAAEVPMLAWQVENGGMAARIERFAGMSSTRVDLLLVADADAMATMLDRLSGDMLTAIKRLSLIHI